MTSAAAVELRHLDNLWIQVSGTRCNIECRHCFNRSGPRESSFGLMTLDEVDGAIAAAAARGVREIYFTGGEPFLHAQLMEMVARALTVAPTTVLTNGMLLRRADTLRALPRDRIVLQISLDSPTPDRHDLHRGRGAWARTRAGIQLARALGFRVRLAATVSTDAEAEEFRQFLDQEKIAEEDRVIRRIVLRGAASDGIALSRTDLVPEVTITAEGVYWHPVGAEDNDLLITRDIFPLSGSFAAVRTAFEREREHANKLARIFNCA